MKTRRRKPVKIRLDGDPILTTVCHCVIENEDIGQIVWALRQVIKRDINCVGVSANQVGYDKRIIAYRPNIGLPEIAFMVNPIIRNVTDDEDKFKEGCLSHPGRQKEISRPTGIVLDYEDISGKLHNGVKFNGFEARIIQHEIDHLNGKCGVAL